MTLKVVWVPTMPWVCQPVYSISQELACPWIISWFNMSTTSWIITISSWKAFIKVKDTSWVEFLIKVYNSEDVILTSANNSDIILKVPIANVQNAQENTWDETALDNIATIEIVAENSSDSYEFILKLAHISSSWIIENINYSWIKLWDSCPECIKCEDWVIQMWEINTWKITSAEFVWPWIWMVADMIQLVILWQTSWALTVAHSMGIAPKTIDLQLSWNGLSNAWWYYVNWSQVSSYNINWYLYYRTTSWGGTNYVRIIAVSATDITIGYQFEISWPSEPFKAIFKLLT